jgi:molybdate/tungstate transport system ATP-binding protein
MQFNEILVLLRCLDVMIRVDNLAIQVGAFRLAGISFEIPTGDYAILMGRTGSGKTTLVESICGLRRIDSGSIWIGNRNITGLPPATRGIGYVPQDGALFTHMTVREHLSFALEIRRLPSRSIEPRVAELARLLQLEPLLDRRPRGLSGGESQRVALGRAMSFEPEVLVLDEPLSALDGESREQTCDVLRTVQRQTGVTTLHITHSVDESRRLADRRLRLLDGQILVESTDTADTDDAVPNLYPA